MEDNILEQQSQRLVVRYGAMRLLGDFETRRGTVFRRNEEVIVRSERGVEWGTVLCPATERTGEYLGNTRANSGRILRIATSEDRRTRSETAEREKQYFTQAAAMISERLVQMQLIDIEQIFGGERLILYYLSEGRIDFRELVKGMAREFNMRIEMRQIGIRDEAKLLAGAQAAARQFISADFAQLAEQTGSLIAPALYGALAASQRLPFSRDQFEATIERSGVGVKTSLKAFAAGFDAAMQVLQPSTSSVADATPVALPLHRQVGPKLKALAQSLEGAFAPAAHEVIASGLTRLADYQDVAYATLYAKRLQDMAGALASSNTATSQAEEILREGARHLALWMSYEDTVRVADLKTRRSRFARVSQEVSLSEKQLIDIHEFMHPRLEEIADTLPAGVGRWLLASPMARAVVGRFTQKGRVVQTSSLRGFLLLYGVASLRSIRPVSLRYQTEQQRIEAWWAQALQLLPQHADLALEVLRGQQLVKGYGDTHARGWRHFEKLMTTLPRLQQLPDAANRLSALRKAALADDSGLALDQAVKQLAPA